MGFEFLDVMFRGICVGVAASITVGPVAVLCIQRTLSKSRRSGIVSGLGVACADTFMAMAALFFYSMLQTQIEQYNTLLRVIGGIFVVIVGVFIFAQNPVPQIRRNRAGKGSNLWSDYLSVLLITLANPAYILIFVALFAALGVNHEGIPYANGLLMILGVLCGTSLWWFLLTFCISFLRRKFRPRHLLWMNRISGSVIVMLGAAAILSIFIHMKVPVHEIFPY